MDIENYPPCIRRMIEDIPNNINHFARFTLVTFLHKVGVSKDEIINLFKNMPGFNLEMVKYQVEQILDPHKSGVEYGVPSCEKIRSYGMCFPDESCKGIEHPLNYRKLKEDRN